MELPKNYTQIGEINRYCRVYLEDYVASYIKQLNGHARDKEIAIGLFGIRKEEDGVSYLFLYGACQLNFLQKTTRHLSQAVLQEAERTRKKYFGEYTFLGCQILNGDRLEGIHVYEQGSCRYIEGYAHFYEKNDSMLQFMLEERKEGTPEKVDREKYEEVRCRQEERKRQAERQYYYKKSRHPYAGEVSRKDPGNMSKRPRRAGVAVFLVFLGLAGVLTLGSGGKLNRLQSAAGVLMDSLSKKQLPDVLEAESRRVQVGTVVAEDKLAEAVLSENEAGTGKGEEIPDSTEADSASSQNSTEESTDGQHMPEENSDGQRVAEENSDGQHVTEENQTEEDVEGQNTTEVMQTEAKEPVRYTVKRGDTLIGICLHQYGSDQMLQAVCELNQIENPDDIKEGKKILLPQ